MKREAVLSERVVSVGIAHLLQHFSKGREQEELCFGLWHQSTGLRRKTAIIYELIKPLPGERNLHGNASFEPQYLARVIREARRQSAGVAFLHSHPTAGWQSMSPDDIVAERDVISYPARATGLPLVGLTVGRDGYWSARWWENSGRKIERHWCRKVRVVRKKKYEIYGNPHASRDNRWSARLRRTLDSWGPDFQRTLEDLEIGIVGVGSVGCIVAEAMARVGVGAITLIDHDLANEHNLDRLLYGTARGLGARKIDIAADALKDHSTNADCSIHRIGHQIQDEIGYLAALDCDVILSCVDRPVGRDVLNYVSQAHLIPVIDAGVSVESFRTPRRFFGAHWRVHVVTPEHQCLRCAGQYSSGDVVSELDGSLSDPQYIKGLQDSGVRQNANTFPFALGAAGLQVNLALRYLLGEKWWPELTRQEYQFVKGTVTREDRRCDEGCSFPAIVCAGDGSSPPYLRATSRKANWKTRLTQACKEFLSKLPLAHVTRGR